MEHALLPVLSLFLVAAAVGIAAHRMRLPYTLALVVAGAVLGEVRIPALEGVELSPELLFGLLLPPLLFEGAFHVDYERVRRDGATILTLAILGVLLTSAVTGALAWLGLAAIGKPMAVASVALVATILSPTDPVSVLALFKSFGVDRRLSRIIEGESLLNDGVAVVAFLLVTAVAGLPGAPLLPATDPLTVTVWAVRTFAWMAGGGVAIGAVVGLTASALTRQVDDRLVEIALTVIATWGAYLLGEETGTSGVLAVVAAGAVFGNVGRRYGMSPSTRVAVSDFWEFAAFFANTLVFLLIGLGLDVVGLLAAIEGIAIVFVAALVGRIVTVAVGYAAARLSWRPLPSAWAPVLVWGGLRGSVSMVLALVLPGVTPERHRIVLLVYGFVAISLLLQGLTMRPLLARLGLMGGSQTAYGIARGRAIMAARALQEIDRAVAAGTLASASADPLRERYRQLRETSEAVAASLSGGDLQDDRDAEAGVRLLAVEEDALREALRDGIVSDEAASELLEDVARRRESLTHLRQEG